MGFSHVVAPILKGSAVQLDASFIGEGKSN